MKVIYILSLGHSGSTILEMSLSHYGDTVGLGELRKVLNQPRILSSQKAGRRKPVCACGQEVSECPFWSELPNPVENTSLREKYGNFFQSLSDDGRYTAAVDSSKTLKAFDILVDLDRQGVVDLYPIFLVRDVRGWMCSGRQRDKRHHGGTRPYMYYLLQWYRQNRKLKHFVDKSRVDYRQVGYEQFCFQPMETIAGMREWVGLPVAEQLEAPRTNAHNLNGNRIRREPRQRIQYDSQWMKEIAPSVLPCLVPTVLLWNRKNVYGVQKGSDARRTV